MLQISIFILYFNQKNKKYIERKFIFSLYKSLIYYTHSSWFMYYKMKNNYSA